MKKSTVFSVEVSSSECTIKVDADIEDITYDEQIRIARLFVDIHNQGKTQNTSNTVKQSDEAIECKNARKYFAQFSLLQNMN